MNIACSAINSHETLNHCPFNVGLALHTNTGSTSDDGEFAGINTEDTTSVIS